MQRLLPLIWIFRMSTTKTDPVGADEPMHLMAIDWKCGTRSGRHGKYS